MAETWTQRADEVLDLMDKLPAPKDAPETDFHRAVFSLCQQLKDTDQSVDSGQMVPPPFI